MRFLIFLAALAAGLFAAAMAQDLSEPGWDRPGGGYASLPSPDAEACRALCADDGLCMAWSYALSAARCELKAVSPPRRADNGFVSGLSARAPDFERRIGLTPAHEASPSAPEPHEAPALRIAQIDPDSAIDPAPELLGGPERNYGVELHGRSGP